MAGEHADQDPAQLEPGPAEEQIEPGPAEIPPRLVAVAYGIALVCVVAPLAVLGAGFAGAVLFTRGRRQAGLGVIAVAVLCVAVGLLLLH